MSPMFWVKMLFAHHIVTLFHGQAAADAAANRFIMEYMQHSLDKIQEDLREDA